VVRKPKVKAALVGIVGGRVQAAGSYADLPFNPYRPYKTFDTWRPFKVRHHRSWITVQVIEAGEDWGWKAVEMGALRRDEKAPTPGVRFT
jgi:hypothetical protein